MKRYISLFFLVLFFPLCVFSQRETGIDAALENSITYLNTRIRPNTKVVVLNFSSIWPRLSEYVVEELIGYIVNDGKLTVVDRANLEAIRQEINFQLSGEVSNESAQAIGQKLGAQTIISGSIADIGTGIRLRIRVLSVESAQVLGMHSVDLAQDNRFTFLTRTVTPSPAAPAAAAPVTAAPATAAPAAAASARPSSAGNLVLLNGGTFTMGSPSNEPERHSDGREGPQRQVTLSAFYIGQYEVTQREYQNVMGINPSKNKGDNYPVDSVSWNNIVDYCNRRSQKEGLTPAYTINGNNVTWNRNANGYRLPTEAEWEYACRAGTSTPFSTGNNITSNQANYEGTKPYNRNASGTYRNGPTAVGSFQPNSWGLYDMHGNLGEWCWDIYGNYTGGAQNNPAGPSSGANRAIRGGGWNSSGYILRSAYRYSDSPSNSSAVRGFRVARNY